jgi:hypothetical protein
MVNFEREREQFESIYPRPRDCHWISQSAVFYQTEYHAWAAQTHIARWEGWKARAKAAAGVSGVDSQG